MTVNEIESGKSFLPLNQLKTSSPLGSASGSESFTDSLNGFISDVNSLQKESADLTGKFIKGEPVDIHDVMIASEKAKTSFQLLTEIRNRFLDLYKEVDKLQI